MSQLLLLFDELLLRLAIERDDAHVKVRRGHQHAIEAALLLVLELRQPEALADGLVERRVLGVLKYHALLHGGSELLLLGAAHGSEGAVARFCCRCGCEGLARCRRRGGGGGSVGIKLLWRVLLELIDLLHWLRVVKKSAEVLDGAIDVAAVVVVDVAHEVELELGEHLAQRVQLGLWLLLLGTAPASLLGSFGRVDRQRIREEGHRWQISRLRCRRCWRRCCSCCCCGRANEGMKEEQRRRHCS